MNCEKCQELLSDYIDGELAIEDRQLLSTHLEDCLHCYSVREDLEAIVKFCEEHRGEYGPVPNERAMWARIRNTVEQERSLGIEVSTVAAASGSQSWWARFSSRRLQLSFVQLAATVSVIAIIVSVATTAGLQKIKNSFSAVSTTLEETPAQPARTMSFSAVEDTVNQQQPEFTYWNQRVEVRKAKWSPQVRDVFDRNLELLDRTVNESKQQLLRNPHDEVSEEMLNAALNEKMQLLKDFSEQ